MQYEHRPELIDVRWAWVTDVAHRKTDFVYNYGPTGTVHLEGCPHINHFTILRPIASTDPIMHRCEHCLRRDIDVQTADVRRRRELATLAAARAADPDLSRRVSERRARRIAERGY
jgi:hypothetical protein